MSDDGGVVTLRTLEAGDADWIFEACQDADIQRWTLVPRPYLREHAESFVKDQAGELSTWAIVDVEGGRPLGMISIHRIDDGVASIGYWVASWGRGRGAASSAVRLVCDLARGMGATSIVADIAEANGASRRTVERCGFSVASVEPQLCRDNGVAVDALRYRLDL